jgi:hypothetical protein
MVEMAMGDKGGSVRQPERNSQAVDRSRKRRGTTGGHAGGAAEEEFYGDDGHVEAGGGGSSEEDYLTWPPGQAAEPD